MNNQFVIFLLLLVAAILYIKGIRQGKIHLTVRKALLGILLAWVLIAVTNIFIFHFI